MAVGVRSAIYLFLRIEGDPCIEHVSLAISYIFPDHRQAMKYTTNYNCNCVIVKGDCLVLVLVFGLHGVSVVYLIKALPALALLCS